MKHEIKVAPAYFARIREGQKTWETIAASAAIQPGDSVTVCEFDPTPRNATTHAPKGFTDSPPLEFIAGFCEFSDQRVTFALLPATKDKRTAKR